MLKKYGAIMLIGMMILSACGQSAIAYNAAEPVAGYTAMRDAVAKTDDKAAQEQIVKTFLATFPTSPLVQGDKAIFIVEKDASRVVLTGDMTNWFDPIYMDRLGQTNYWATMQTYSPTARLDYRFGVGGGGGLFNDPRNPNIALSGLGRNSELRMPEYITPTEIVERPNIPKGTLDKLGIYKSTMSPTSHDLNVYLPPNYDPSKKYPSVYFQDGDDYQNYAFTPTIFDNAIADGILPPLIGVFVTPSREQGRQVDYNLNDLYAQFFATELVPMIDAKYSTINDPKQRVVVGDSYGGLISIYIAWLYPDIFGGVVNQSGFVSRYNGRLLTLLAAQPPTSVRIATVVGTFETCVGGPVTGRDCNFLDGNRTLKQVLDAGGVTQLYNEYPQGHAWGFWRDHIDREVAWALNWQK